MYKIGHILFGAGENIGICQFEKKNYSGLEKFKFRVIYLKAFFTIKIKLSYTNQISALI